MRDAIRGESGQRGVWMDGPCDVQIRHRYVLVRVRVFDRGAVLDNRQRRRAVWELTMWRKR